MRPNQHRTTEAVQCLLRLRRIERTAKPSQWPDLGAVRDFVETLVGPTLRPADAARLLGISRPALKRWTDSEEISTVLTPTGRKEVPLSELLDLLEQVEERRQRSDEGRPVSHVIRERKRQAAETIEIDRLLPRRGKRGHRVAELQALAYHRLIAERLDERMVADARRRLEHWQTRGSIHPAWADRWQTILDLPLPEIAKTISSDSEKARALRQTSPFAGVLNQQERRLLVQAVEKRSLA